MKGFEEMISRRTTLGPSWLEHALQVLYEKSRPMAVKESILGCERVSAHEAAHAVVADHLGRRVTCVYRDEEGGYTGLTQMHPRPRATTLLNAAAISLAGYLQEALDGYEPEDGWTSSSDVRLAWRYLSWNGSQPSPENVTAAWDLAATILIRNVHAVRNVAEELLCGDFTEDRPMTRQFLRRVMRSSQPLSAA